CRSTQGLDHAHRSRISHDHLRDARGWLQQHREGCAAGADPGARCCRDARARSALDPHQRRAREPGRNPPRVQGRRGDQASRGGRRRAGPQRPEARRDRADGSQRAGGAGTAGLRKSQARRGARRAAVRGQGHQPRAAAGSAHPGRNGRGGPEFRAVQLELRRDRRPARRHGAAPACRRARGRGGRRASARDRRSGPRLRRARRSRGSRDRAGPHRRCRARAARRAARGDAQRHSDGDSQRCGSRQRHVRRRSGDRRQREPAFEERPGREAHDRARLRPERLARVRADRRNRRRQWPQRAPVRARQGSCSLARYRSRVHRRRDRRARERRRRRRAGHHRRRSVPGRRRARRERTAVSFLEFPIRRYQFTLVAFAMLVALGLTSFFNIPRQEDPHFPVGRVRITEPYPGAEPQEVERLVVKPIEDRLSELDDMKRIESRSSDGGATLVAEFYSFVDAEKKYEEVERELSALRPQLPPEIGDILILKVNPGLVNIVQFALVAPDAPYAELEEFARDLKDTLKTVDGVRNAQTWAYPARELRVALDLPRMAELKLAPGRVMQALQSENANIPGGSVDVGSRSFSLKTSGSYETLDEVRDTVVAVADGRSVRVRDIAEVSWDTQQHVYIGRFNGQRAVFVTANQKDGYNIFDVRQRILAAAERFKTQLPKRIHLELGFDQSENVEHRLDRLQDDFGIAIALVAITLLPLGLRAASVVMISIPLSLAIGLAALYFLGFSLNQISIAGFVVALGLLVDDSIVVVENIARFLREGHSRMQAAILATRQIFEAIVGCTATIMFAFLPLMMMGGTSGQFIRVLPTAVLVTVGASLLVALTIIPFLASRVLKEHEDPHGNRLL